MAVAATLLATSVQAAPLVFSNGKQLTEAEILLRIEQGKMPTIIGNQTYEDGKFISATDSKNPVVKAVAKMKIAMVERANSQDKKREVREEQQAAAQAAWVALGNTKIEWSARSEALYNQFIEGFLSKDYFADGANAEEAEMFRSIVIGADYATQADFLNGSYGIDAYTRENIQAAVKAINAIQDDAAHYQAIRYAQGDVTYAIKLNVEGGITNWKLNGNDYHMDPTDVRPDLGLDN